MKVLRLALPLLALIFTFLTVYAQSSGVTAEAVGQANLRASAELESDLLGSISSGTRYPVLGRSEFYPWVLLADPATQQPIGWVFDDLLDLQGDLYSLPISSLVVGAPVLPTPTPAAALPTATLTGQTNATTAIPSAPTPVPLTGVTATVLGEINIRYGPGTEYDRIGVAEAGDTFTITAHHTQLPWVQISYPDSPNGLGWIAADLLEINGDLNSVTPISQTVFNLPPLTPTPSVVERAAIGDISPEFAALGAQLWNNLLASDFDPQTSRLGAVYLMNLKTGEALSFGGNIAFSGMSINKVAILTTLFGRINDVPDDATATIIAEAMICSDNIATNKLLALIGDGDPYTGADRVSAFLQQLGLNETFIYTPYSNDPYITPEAPQTRVTGADQTSAEPDPYNQLTVVQMGTLLQDIYQCAISETGPLLDDPQFTGEYSPMECRKIIDVMEHNKIGNFIEAGVPASVPIAHKHGWINDTHGDAALVLSPGGDYILVMTLHNPTWLEFAESEAVIEESSREVYNYFNPTAPLDAVRPPDVPAECNLLGNPAIDHLLSPTFGLDPATTG